jgi:hypothetical protein
MTLDPAFPRAGCTALATIQEGREHDKVTMALGQKLRRLSLGPGFAFE